MKRRTFFATILAALVGRKAVAAAAPKTDDYRFSYSFVTVGGDRFPVTPLPNGSSKPAQAAYFIGADGRLWLVQEKHYADRVVRVCTGPGVKDNTLVSL